MHNVIKVWITGCLATAATAASTIFNAFLAVNNTSNDNLSLVLRILLFVALGFSFLGCLSLLYFTALYVRNIKRRSLISRKAIWSLLAFGVIVDALALAFPLTTLIWLTIELQDVPKRILDRDPIVWLAAWYGCWGGAAITQLTLFTILGFWTKRQLRPRSVARLDIDFGTRLPPPLKQIVPDENRSYHSRETTIAELPRTPTSPRPASFSHYSASFNRPSSSSRTHLPGLNRSAKSSLDLAFPAGEAISIDSAFDRWDTSTVHSEMRAAVGTCATITRTGLETIPGSRPDSPEDVIENPSLSSSPEVRSSSPQAISSDTATALGDWSSSPSRYVANSSPPSSPPNFSRPTSKHKNQPLVTSFETSMQEIIHPLFRPTSPHPPPIATAGTMVTASPLANQPITPRTLANLRNHSKSSSTVGSHFPKPTGHWRAMPSISQTSERRPSTSGSQGPGSPPPGSPGPSIVDEEELPPILPGFVLSAGQRSSMLGYTNRKSLRKDRRASQLSTGGG